MEYSIPPIHVFGHIIAGMIAYFYPIVWILILGIKLSELAANSRIHFFNWDPVSKGHLPRFQWGSAIKKGNSVSYTYHKLIQYFFGYALMDMYQNINF
jgi:hypothetical protein